MKKVLLLLLFLFAVAPIDLFAGDFATLNFIGFSKDGKYMAFEEYGEQDGSGFPYANYMFLNASNNTIAAKSVTVRIDSETSSIAAARKKAKLLAAPQLKKLGILAGNTGDLLVSRMLTDLSATKATSTGSLDPIKINFAREIGSMYRSGDYDLVLTPSEAKDKECEAYGETVYKLELTLKDNQNDTTQTLQKDTSLPKGRGCPLYYGIRSIYWYRNTVAVFVEVYTMGFEGPDMRFMAVTGNVADPRATE